jgi:hypothetical protein
VTNDTEENAGSAPNMGMSASCSCPPGSGAHVCESRTDPPRPGNSRVDLRDSSLAKQMTQDLLVQQRGALTVAKRLQPGDVVLSGEAKTVERTLGVQGRKPKTGAPLMRIEFVDGETIRVREDKALRIARAAGV